MLKSARLELSDSKRACPILDEGQIYRGNNYISSPSVCSRLVCKDFLS